MLFICQIVLHSLVEDITFGEEDQLSQTQPVRTLNYLHLQVKNNFIALGLAVNTIAMSS